MNDLDPTAELRTAIQLEEVVTFDYEKDGALSTRVFSPWEITNQDLALGWDHDRSAIRSFRPDKIVGAVDSYPHDEYARPST